MSEEAKRLRDLAKLHRDLAEVVRLGREERLAVAEDLERRADRLEGMAGLPIRTHRETGSPD